MLLSGLVSTFTASAVAHSAAERFALLEERDKFLRSSMLTTFTFNNVAYEEGICLSLSCHLHAHCIVNVYNDLNTFSITFYSCILFQRMKSQHL